MVGRPTKLTEEVQDAIVRLIEVGNYADTAAQSVGIDPKTFYNWLHWGEDGQEPYAAFFQAVTCARAKAETDLVEVVRAGDAKGTGFGAARAAAFILERTRPRRYAARVKMQVADELSRSLDIIRSVVDEPTYIRILEALDADQERQEVESLPRDEETCH